MNESSNNSIEDTEFFTPQNSLSSKISEGNDTTCSSISTTSGRKNIIRKHSNSNSNLALITNILCIQDRNIIELKVLLGIIIVLNIISAFTNGLTSVWYINIEKIQSFKIIESLLCILIVCLTTATTLLAGRLILVPSSSLSLFTLLIISLVEILYIVQCISTFLHYGFMGDAIIFTVVTQTVQIYSVVVLYRFWELVEYNYDDGRSASIDFRNSNSDNSNKNSNNSKKINNYNNSSSSGSDSNIIESSSVLTVPLIRSGSVDDDEEAGSRETWGWRNTNDIDENDRKLF